MGRVFFFIFSLFFLPFQSLLWSPEVISSISVNTRSLLVITGQHNPELFIACECFLPPILKAATPIPTPSPAPEQSTNIFTDANSDVLRIWAHYSFFLWVYSPKWNYRVRGYEQFYGSYYMSLDCCPERLNQFLGLPTADLYLQFH